MAEDNSSKEISTGVNSSQLATNSIESLLYHATAEELDPLFDRIKLPHIAREKSKDIFQDVFSHGIFSSDPKIPNSELFASILYIAVIETSSMKESDPDGHKSSFPTLTDILMATNVNINKVFMSLQMINEKVHLSETFRRNFYNLTQRYLVISVLFKMFQSKCGDVFQKETKENDENAVVAPPIRKTEGVECRKKLCWVLFLLTKYHLLPNSPELYLHFQLLLCCLEYVLSKTPMFLLNSAYASIRFRSDSLCEGESMLEKLAKDFGVNFIETQALHENSTEPFFKGLSDNNDDTDLLFQCEKLCDMYKKISSEPGALNELLFLSNDARVMPLQVTRVSPSAAGNNAPKLGQMTPIRGTLNAVHQLEKLLHGREEEAGKSLKDFLKGCSPDPTDRISELVKDLKDRFLTAYQSQCEAGSSQHALGQQRLSQGTRLFYKVLENMVNKNSDKSTEAVLGPLLNKDIFIRSVFAFSMEIILATYGQQWDPETRTLTFGDTSFPFPWILKVLSLKAYKFDIMLENFMWTVENLSTDIIKYLQNSCHQKILERLAWEEDSPVFDALSQSDLGQMMPPSASPVKGLNGHSHFELLLSPGPSSIPTDDSVSNPHELGSFSSSLPKRRSQSLTAFLTKVNKLGFSRISFLCSNLDLSEKDKDRIWTCFDYCLRENFTLMKNRHIDQVIMCCIHGICKALNHNISLDMIVEQYKKMPHAKPQVYENVFMSDGEISPISDFYDKVFEESKTHEKALQFSQSSSLLPPLSPRPKFAWGSPRPCHHAKPNLTVSPMRPNAMRSPGKFNSFIGSPINPQSPKLYKMINEKMSAKSQSLQRTVKRLDFDDTSQQSSDFKQRKLDLWKLQSNSGHQ